MAIRLEYSTTAKCRPEHVWKKFENVEQWAWWNRVIGRAKWLAGGPWEKGSQLEVEVIRPKNLRFKSVIVESAPPNKVAWVGKGSGLTGEQWFSFELQPDGQSTLLKTWEDFSGVGTLFFGNGRKSSILKAYEEWLTALKVEAEKLAREERAYS